MFDGQDFPLQNPYTPYQSLLMMTDFTENTAKPEPRGNQGGQKDRYESAVAFPGNPAPMPLVEKTKKQSRPPLKIYQVCQRSLPTYERQKTVEGLTKFRNLPGQYTFVEFQKNIQLRRKYFMQALNEENVLREVAWKREDEEKYPLPDYISEQSKVKVWVETPKSRKDHRYEIRTIDVCHHIQKSERKFHPSMQSRSDSDLQPPEPQSWQILRNLFIDKFCLTTIKQQPENPRNIILALRPARENGQSLMVQEGQACKRPDQVLYFVGTLSEDFESFESL